MAHAATGRGGRACDKSDHRFLVSRFDQEFGAVLFGAAADLADHDDGLGLIVAEEQRQSIDEVRAVDGIAADADAGRLAEPDGGGLRHRLVSEGARARDDADLAGLVDVAGHDADLALAGRDDPGAIGADQPRLRAIERALHLDHVEHRHAFGDADDQRHARVDRLEDGISGKGRRHINRARVDSGGRHCLFDGVEHRKAEMRRSAFARRHAADHLGAIGDGLLGIERALRASEALADDARVLVDEDGHGTIRLPCKFQAAAFTAATAFLAASSRSSAGMMARPESRNNALPRSTLVPSSLTTSGTVMCISRAAAMMPSAMVSQRMMPPKMLTSTPFTCGSDRMILNASVTRSLVAPPPTSRKFAGSPP